MRKLTQEEAEIGTTKHGCFLLEEYTRGKNKHLFECAEPKCQNTFIAEYTSVQMGKSRYCSYHIKQHRFKCKRLTQKAAEMKVLKYGCVLLGKYTKYIDKHLFKCAESNCKDTFISIYNNVQNGTSRYCFYHAGQHSVKDKRISQKKRKNKSNNMDVCY